MNEMETPTTNVCTCELEKGEKTPEQANTEKPPQWGTVKGAIVGTVVAGGALLLLPVLLPAAGFGSAGIIAGSWAAGIQGSAVASSSVFAACQSAGVVGLSSLASGVTLATGAVAGAAGAVVREKEKEKEKKDPAERKDTDLCEKCSGKKV